VKSGEPEDEDAKRSCWIKKAFRVSRENKGYENWHSNATKTN